MFNKDEPSDIPSDAPSLQPSSLPSDVPSDQPSLNPSSMPSDFPSSIPSTIPSDIPSLQPSSMPSLLPSDEPSLLPSSLPSLIPSDEPSMLPSMVPSGKSSQLRLSFLQLIHDGRKYGAWYQIDCDFHTCATSLNIWLCFSLTCHVSRFNFIVHFTELTPTSLIFKLKNRPTLSSSVQRTFAHSI